MSAIKEIYLWTKKVRPENIIMSLSDIDQQSEFERQTIISSASLLTVSWSNPVKYGYSSAVRYWWWQTKTNITFPTKWEMFVDCIFGWHNRNSESWLFLFFTDGNSFGFQQWTLTTTTSQPRLNYPWGGVQPTSVNFMDGARHTLKATWNGWTYNARIDSTQILNNVSWTNKSGYTFRFVIFGGSAYWIVQKSIYNFYVKDLS